MLNVKTGAIYRFANGSEIRVLGVLPCAQSIPSNPSWGWVKTTLRRLLKEAGMKGTYADGTVDFHKCMDDNADRCMSAIFHVTAGGQTRSVAAWLFDDQDTLILAHVVSEGDLFLASAAWAFRGEEPAEVKVIEMGDDMPDIDDPAFRALLNA